MRGAIDTVTIWNRWRNPDTRKDEYFRHVIPDCTWEQENVTSASGTGAIIASTFSVLITASADYKPFREWKNLAAEDKRRYFTLNTSDLVAKGAVQIDITGAAPFTESEVKVGLLPDAFNVKSFDDQSEPYKRGRHYEVMGV